MKIFHRIGDMVFMAVSFPGLCFIRSGTGDLSPIQAIRHVATKGQSTVKLVAATAAREILPAA